MLATDLSSRCDRAFDRAVQLASGWGAGLVIAHVTEPDCGPEDAEFFDPPCWRRGRDTVERMQRQVRREFPTNLENVEVRIGQGDPAQCLLDIARAEGCDLIVTGMARDEPFGRMFLGTTVNRLVRRSSAPLLVVRNRAIVPYRRIVVATDFSESARHALVTTAAYFPEAAFTLFHGYDIPFGGLLDKRGERDELYRMEKRCGDEFLAATPLDERQRGRVDVRIEHGAAGRLLWDYVREQGVDLTVIGSHGRSAVFDVLIGSMTKRFLESAVGDVLIVIDPHARKWG